MKRLLFIYSALTITAFLFLSFQAKKASPKFKSCDLIFVSNPLAQKNTIQQVSKSKFTHIGLVLINEKGKTTVYYVGDKVKKATVAEFLALSPTGKYDLMRLRDSVALPPHIHVLMLEEINKLMGVPNDQYLKWTDMEIYNSEFIWKIFKRSISFETGELKTLGSYDLSAPAIQKKLKEKYGDNIPLEEKAISPDDIYNWSGLVKLN